jgi:hypothetical protein
MSSVPMDGAAVNALMLAGRGVLPSSDPGERPGGDEQEAA